MSETPLPYDVFVAVNTIVDEIHGPYAPSSDGAANVKRLEERSNLRGALFYAAGLLEDTSSGVDRGSWNDMYDAAFSAAALYLGLGWFARIFLSWALKRAITLLVDWYYTYRD